MMNLSAAQSPERSQDPSADLDWSKDWTAWLAEVGADTISTSSWTVTPTGPSLHGGGLNAAKTIATIWIKDTTAGTTYTLTNSIVTAAGRKNDSSFRLFAQHE